MIPKHTLLWMALGTAIVLGLALLRVGVDLYTNWLWFHSLGFASAYWTLLKAKSSLFLLFWMLFLLLAGLNLGIARHYGGRTRRTLLGVIVVDTFPFLGGTWDSTYSRYLC